MYKKLYFLTCLPFFFSNQLAFAGNLPGAITVTVSEAYYHFDDDRDMDNTTIPNAAIAYNFNDHWAIEGSVALVNTDRQDNNDSDDDDDDDNDEEHVHGFLYTIDGIYRFTRFGHFEPYLLAGIGILGLKPNGNDAIQSGNVNAGLGTQLFFGNSIALRGEVRDIYTTTGSYKNDYEFNLGLSFLFNCNKSKIFKM